MNALYRYRMPWLFVAVAVGLATLTSAPLQAQEVSGGEVKTLAVVAIAPYQKLVDDITFLGTLAGKPELGQMVEGGLAFFTQGKGAAALDKTQPWGLIVQTDGMQFLPVACLPVTKVDDLLQIAVAYGAELKDAEGGLKQLVLPSEQTLYVKDGNGRAFISMSTAALDRLPEDPAGVFAKQIGEYDIMVRVDVKNVPEMYRQLAVSAMQAGMQRGLEAAPYEDEARQEMRKKIAEVQLEQAKRMVEETESFTIGWAIDSQQQRTYIDSTIQAVPGSRMAKELAAYGDSKTNFAGFFQQDAAATVSFVNQADPELVKADLQQLEGAVQAARDQFDKAINENDDIPAEVKVAFKAAAADMFDAFAATIKEGRLDGGAALHVGADSLMLIAGAFVKEPEKIESGLKKIEESLARDPEFPGIEWNAETHSGVKFHTLTVPVPADQESPRKLLGEETDVAVGIGEEAVYLGFGRDNLDAIKKAIDASAAEPNQKVPPFEMAISITPFAEMATTQADDADQRAIAESVAQMLRNEAQGRDHIRAIGQTIPNGLRYHFEAEEGVLKALGKAATEAQQRALQANQ